MENKLKERFNKVVPDVDFCSLRYNRDSMEGVRVKKDILQPLSCSSNQGAIITVHDKGGFGYGATSDLSETGLRQAVENARAWAKAHAGRMVTDYSKIEMPHPKGEFRPKIEKSWDSVSLSDKISRLTELSKTMKIDDKIVDWFAALRRWRSERLYLTNGGGEVFQETDILVPDIQVTANEGSETQMRSFYGTSACLQKGLGFLDEEKFFSIGGELAKEALELLSAPNCPSGKRDLLLAPDQMSIQIHESIGHPTELDRILGDERNYAGTSFVKPEMFGSYQYGSNLLNVSYDPTIDYEAASFAFDEDGLKAEKQYIIKDGFLVRPQGGLVSQKRSGLPGVATARTSSWNRPTMDRLSNLNVEIGDSSFDDMVSNIENGIYLKTNISWSIDDSRNKFQFGCEWGRLIENGKLTTVVKKPNYRGISKNFWRSLKAVGNKDTWKVMAAPYCGKGEPNQGVTTGHASPVCLFGDIDVFGGE